MYPSLVSLTVTEINAFASWLTIKGIRLQIVGVGYVVTSLRGKQYHIRTEEEAMNCIALLLCYEDFEELGLYGKNHGSL